MKLRFRQEFRSAERTLHHPGGTWGTACQMMSSVTVRIVDGHNGRISDPCWSADADVFCRTSAERTAASRFWLEPPGWVPSRRLAQSSVPRHGGSQVETQAQNSVRHQECFEWMGSLIVRTSRGYLETATVFSSKNPSQWFAALGSA